MTDSQFLSVVIPAIISGGMGLVSYGVLKGRTNGYAHRITMLEGDKHNLVGKDVFKSEICRIEAGLRSIDEKLDMIREDLLRIEKKCLIQMRWLYEY